METIDSRYIWLSKYIFGSREEIIGTISLEQPKSYNLSQSQLPAQKRTSAVKSSDARGRGQDASIECYGMTTWLVQLGERPPPP